MAVSEYMYSRVIAAGLEAIPIGHLDVNPKRVQDSAILWDHWSTDHKKLKSQAENPGQPWYNFDQCISGLLEFCGDAELIICGPQQEVCAAVVAEKLGVPLVPVILTPALLYQPNNWWRLAYLSREHRVKSDAYLQARRRIGLENWKAHWNYKRLIFCASPTLYPFPPHCDLNHQTGFLFENDCEQLDWEPSEKLKNFFSVDPKPLVLSFSSQPVNNIQPFLDAYIRAATKLNCRILIQGSWPQLNEYDIPDDINHENVMLLSFSPQDWIFSQASALITHGGIGTIARALRNGCPLLLEPHTTEQCFNARSVLSWNAGAAIHPKMISADSIARILEKKTLTRRYKETAESIQQQIKKENGITDACNLIESWLP
ncbi:MAG: glycosyltransferase [Gammaproteobacteria bacterium]|nr:glycosyltransferase [Gammaproteobacteria bacterium]